MKSSVRPAPPSFSLFLPALLAVAFTAAPAHAQIETKPAETKAAITDKSSAYYNFSMGHLYAELAGAYGNRGEYLNKAIEYYKEALKLDPSATFLTEELTDLYLQSGQVSRALLEAEDMLKQNPDNLEARRILGRIYTRLIGDNKIDEKMLAKSIEQYKFIVSKEPTDQESALVLGRLYRVAHNSVEAEKVYKGVLAKEADNEEALTGLAMVYADVGDTKGAIEMLRRASDKDPNPRSLGALAGFYEQINDYSNAAEIWKKLMPLIPDENKGRLKHALAQDLLYADKLDEALELYKELAAEDARDPQVQLHLSQIYRQKGDFAQARSAFNKAKAVAGDDLEVRYDEVNLLDAEGKTTEAIQTLKGILDSTAKKQYNENEAASRSRLTERLGILYRNAGKYTEAVNAFREIGELDQGQSSHAAVQIIETYRIAKNMTAARSEADAAMKKFPKDRTVVMVHASLIADMGKVDQAVAEIRSLGTVEKDRDALLAIAQIYEKGKKFAEEAKTLDAAEAVSPTTPEKQGVQFARGAMFERMKNFDSAEAEFRKVLANDPDNAGALNYLGYMLADRGVRLDEAQKMIGRAVELDPTNGAYLDSLGWVLYRQNKLDEAEDNLRKALQRIGTDPTVHDHLGDVYLKEGKVREAISQWQASLKEWEGTPSAEADPEEVAKVTKKLESARVRIAKEDKR